MTALLALLLVLSLQVVESDSSVAQADTTVQHSLEPLSDSLSVPDSFDLQAESPQENNKGWWKRNEGTFLGSLLAALVAAFSAFLAYWLSERRTRLRQRQIYFRLLHEVYHELEWHESLKQRLQNHLNEVLRIALAQGEIVITSPPEIFRVEYLDSCRSKILEYDRFNTELLPYLSTYINLVNVINGSVDLRKLRELLAHFDDAEGYKMAAQEYFQRVFDEMKKLDVAIPELQEGIVNEMQKKA